MNIVNLVVIYLKNIHLQKYDTFMLLTLIGVKTISKFTVGQNNTG